VFLQVLRITNRGQTSIFFLLKVKGNSGLEQCVMNLHYLKVQFEESQKQVGKQPTQWLTTDSGNERDIAG
jgi:hypothetical protein